MSVDPNLMLDRLTDNLDIHRQTFSEDRFMDARSAAETGSETMADETIGFIGTGRMGGPTAGRLLDAGYSLSIFDTRADPPKPLVARGARLAKSPAEVASS